jgi:hypothetical protein
MPSARPAGSMFIQVLTRQYVFMFLVISIAKTRLKEHLLREAQVGSCPVCQLLFLTWRYNIGSDIRYQPRKRISRRAK